LGGEDHLRKKGPWARRDFFSKVPWGISFRCDGNPGSNSPRVGPCAVGLQVFGPMVRKNRTRPGRRAALFRSNKPAWGGTLPWGLRPRGPGEHPSPELCGEIGGGRGFSRFLHPFLGKGRRSEWKSRGDPRPGGGIFQIKGARCPPVSRFYGWGTHFGAEGHRLTLFPKKPILAQWKIRVVQGISQSSAGERPRKKSG